MADINFKSIVRQTTQDLSILDKSIAKLEKQVDSLAEVVLSEQGGL